MRWEDKRKKNLNKRMIKHYFAWVPVIIGIQIRWLEYIIIEGHYWEGQSGTIYWENDKFLN